LLDALHCHAAGDTAAAEYAYRAVLAAEPDQPNALFLYGVLLADTGAPHAQALLARAAALRPADPECRLALANALHRAGDTQAAAEGWRQVLAIAPCHAAASANLSAQLRVCQDFPAAIAVARSSLVHHPRNPPLWRALATALLAAQHDEPALTAADALLLLDPADPEAWLVRGTALSRLGNFPAAIAALEQCLRLDPASARGALHLGNTLVDLDRMAEAEPHLRRAIALDPSLVEAHTSLGFLEVSCHRIDAAIACYNTALALRPGYAEAHSNLAAALLLAGDYPHGFAAYEWRKRHALFASFYWQSDRPEWRGESLAGRTILVFCEQGFGDTIMCARYLPVLAQRGARIVLVCPAALAGLLAQLPGVAAIVCCADPQSGLALPPGTQAPPYDVWIDQLSLPRVLATTPASIPHTGGYLRADPELIQAWRDLLPEGRKVGLVWAGNPAHGNDRRRSLPLPALAPLLCAGGAHFVSLQCGSAGAAASAAALIDYTDRLTDYAQTAALIACLDLVIAVDTSVAHLAGALGKPCWLMLPYAPEWRWMLGRADSPWYASLRLFRQPAAGDWAAVVGEIVTAFSPWFGSSTVEPC
jgi:tetratricopeptide (TPR) repeat protein